MCVATAFARDALLSFAVRDHVVASSGEQGVVAGGSTCVPARWTVAAPAPPSSRALRGIARPRAVCGAAVVGAGVRVVAIRVVHVHVRVAIGHGHIRLQQRRSCGASIRVVAIRVVRARGLDHGRISLQQRRHD